MTRRGVVRFAGLGLLIGSLVACDLMGPDGPSGPGDFEGTLISPNGAEGSVVLELTGGIGLGTVSPEGGEVLYQHFGESSRIVMVLDEPGEIRFTVRTEDVGKYPDVRVIQVADGQNNLRPSVSGYEVTFTRTKDSSKKGKGG
jgi:hypothetical protein